MESIGYAVSFSNGIRKIRHISTLLGVSDVVSPRIAFKRQQAASCVVVWGRKQNSKRALRYAAAHDLPVHYVEDGWVRSCSSNAHSRVCYSVLVDNMGVYYDSSVPSSLESYLNLPDDEFDALVGPDELAYSESCRQLLVENNITKYNYCRTPDTEVINADDRQLILVIDQTRDDASVAFGNMNADAFTDMLDRALEENPHARVVVRTHPDVVSGRRKGYLQQRAIELGVELSAAGDNPVPWLKKADTVYVGTSQLGYEALLCGCTVKVSGLPFYAGWGLTEDSQHIARRVRRRSLEQLFHATHVHHARYCCPVLGVPWTLKECLQHVLLQQRYFKRNAGNRVAVGITPWKKRYIKQFLRSPYSQLRFSAKHECSDDETPVVWSFSDSHGNTRQCTRVEDGFIRSVGLGSNYVPPASLVFDEAGLYFDAASESSLEVLLNNYLCSEDELHKAKVLRATLLANGLTKYNVGSASDEVLVDSPAHCPTHEGQQRLLVVGQVEGDQSIVRGGMDITTNTQLLQAVREANKAAYIVYKPHPDVVSGNRRGKVEKSDLASCIDKIEDTRDLLDCLDDCDELHTITSLSGFEALLRDKKVVTYGMPFYAGWGLTQDRHQCARRQQTRSIEELMYISLAVYPHYLDLQSGEFITVEQLCEKMKLIHQDKFNTVNTSWTAKMKNVMAALCYNP